MKEVRQLEWWTNEQHVRIMKQCCSCTHCKCGNTMSTDVAYRYCSPHKKKGRYTHAQIVLRNDLGCEDWTPKTGLKKVGRGDGHELRRIDVEAVLKKMGIKRDQPVEKKERAVTDKRVRESLARDLEKFERESIAEQEGGKNDME